MAFTICRYRQRAVPGECAIQTTTSSSRGSIHQLVPLAPGQEKSYGGYWVPPVRWRRFCDQQSPHTKGGKSGGYVDDRPSHLHDPARRRPCRPKSVGWLILGAGHEKDCVFLKRRA